MKVFEKILSPIVMFAISCLIVFFGTFFSKAYTSDDFDYNGMVKILGEHEECSGAVVRFKGQAWSSKAFVLTSGHCLFGVERAFHRRQMVYQDIAISRTLNQLRMEAMDGDRFGHQVKVKKLVYATTYTVDAALFQLGETYNDLLDMGVLPFDMSDSPPKMGIEIDIVSGLLGRGSRCRIVGHVHEFFIEEDDIFLRNSPTYHCRLGSGTSGSPLVERGTRTILAIHSALWIGGRRVRINDCPSGILDVCRRVNPHRNRARVKSTEFASQIHVFSRCFNSQFKIDLNLSGCELPDS